MAKFTPPDALDFTKPAAWPDWKQRFSRYRVASKLTEDDESVQVSALIYSMGAGLSTYSSLSRLPTQQMQKNMNQ